ncbi:hypothetical protein [Streptomyces misionensis]|uniref:hypothetical protein n=1 Tax=Streptomyces misionensis TaxID=67331 RepID=UPI0033A242E8
MIAASQNAKIRQIFVIHADSNKGEGLMRKLLLTAALAGGLAVGALTATPASANATVVAEFTTEADYLAADGTPLTETNPVSDPAVAVGPSVTSFEATVAAETGLSTGDPISQEYEAVGKSVSLELTDETGETSVSVTRVSAGGDVPETVVADPSQPFTVSKLPDESSLMTVDGSEGATVSTLSPKGELTVWSSETVSASQLKAWATAVNSKTPSPVAVESEQPIEDDTMTAPGETAIAVEKAKAAMASTGNDSIAAKPSCQVIRDSKPYKHNTDHISYGGTLSCNTKGLMSFSVGIEQYRGLGIWKSKAYDTKTNYEGTILGRLADWHCAKGTGTQTYRGKVGTASLRSPNGVWAKPKSLRFSGEVRINCG